MNHSVAWGWIRYAQLRHLGWEDAIVLLKRKGQDGLIDKRTVRRFMLRLPMTKGLSVFDRENSVHFHVN